MSLVMEQKGHLAAQRMRQNLYFIKLLKTIVPMGRGAFVFFYKLSKSKGFSQLFLTAHPRKTEKEWES